MIGMALDSVLRCEYDDFDVHIMDQSETDETERLVEERVCSHPRGGAVRYHHIGKAGLSRATNLGLAAATGDVVAKTDDDCEVPPNWLSHVAAAFEEDAELGLMYGQVHVPESLREVARSGAIVPSLYFSEARRFSRSDGFALIGMGANMAMRKSLVQKIGGFDEALGAGGPLRSADDFDLALRIYRSGAAVRLLPESIVHHYGVRTRDQWPSTLSNYGIGDAAFYMKHIRCGDLLAARLFLDLIARSIYREARESWRKRRWVPNPHGRSLWRGIREGARFGIDRVNRLYVETERAKMVATPGAQISAAARSSRPGE